MKKHKTRAVVDGPAHLGPGVELRYGDAVLLTNQEPASLNGLRFVGERNGRLTLRFTRPPKRTRSR